MRSTHGKSPLGPVLLRPCRYFILVGVLAWSHLVVGDEPFTLHIQSTGTSASFRGISVSSDGTIWVGGSDATLLSSSDRGKSWRPRKLDVPDSSDFRDVETTTSGQIVVMSAGKGADSRVMLTKNEGRSWQLVLSNPDPDGFFNGMAFANDGFGALVGDPVNSTLTVFVTNDGGRRWRRIRGPRVIPGEYGFAASGTGVVVDSEHRIGIVTGGSRSRYYRRQPESEDWTASDLGLRHGTASSGAFSTAFAGKFGVAMGGDYQQPERSARNVAITRDLGMTWSVLDVSMPHKACVLALGGKRFLACGRTGIAIAADGSTWRELSKESFYTMAAVPSSTASVESKATEVWLAGAAGRVALLTTASK